MVLPPLIGDYPLEGLSQRPAHIGAPVGGKMSGKVPNLLSATAANSTARWSFLRTYAKCGGESGMNPSRLFEVQG